MDFHFDAKGIRSQENPDVLTDLLDDLRQARPSEEGEFMAWLDSIGQVIAAYPTELRRNACVILVANDICAATCVPLGECVKLVRKAVQLRLVVGR